jgi:hypothetical protein
LDANPSSPPAEVAPAPPAPPTPVAPPPPPQPPPPPSVAPPPQPPPLSAAPSAPVDALELAGPAELVATNPREARLCATASSPDWLYLGGLVVLDGGAIWLGSSPWMKYQVSSPVARMTGPAVIGLTWGATVGGAWLALPKCSAQWVPRPTPGGRVSDPWPLALSLALLAGATAPIVDGIAVGFNLPIQWTTAEREIHLVVAGVAGFGGALLPYLLPPKTWAAAREIERLQIATDGRGVFLGYGGSF